MKGTLCKWEGQFGWITPDDGDFSDVFLPGSLIPDFCGQPIAIGTRFEFDVGPPRDLHKKHKGGVAHNVRLLREEYTP
jgi:hypothetical protein